MSRYVAPIWISLGTALQLFHSRPRGENGLDILQRDHDRIMLESRHWLM